MLIKKYKIFSLLALVALGYGCEQSAPANIYEEKGDLYFSGFYFNYKNKITPVGPGPNRFLGDSTAAWVDNQQKLHLKIQQKNGFWQCSEIVSTKRFGYGTYQLTCETDIRNFDPMTVFGFFTWDDYSFQNLAYQGSKPDIFSQKTQYFFPSANDFPNNQIGACAVK